MKPCTRENEQTPTRKADAIEELMFKDAEKPLERLKSGKAKRFKLTIPEEKKVKVAKRELRPDSAY